MTIIRDNILCENVAFVDGMPGTGKSLIAPFVSSMKECELWKLNHLYEYILIHLSRDKITLESATALLRLYADLDLYNLNISRDLNFRRTDDSGPHYNLLEERYKARLDEKDGDGVVDKIINEKPFLIIMSHFIITEAKNLKMIYSDRNLHFITLLRHPGTIVRRWNEGDWFNRINIDPREFTPAEETNGIKHPWYARKDKLYEYTPIDHIANYVINYFKSEETLFDDPNYSVIRIHFEKFEVDTEAYIDRLECVFGERTKVTEQLLNKFSLPRAQSCHKRYDDAGKDLEYCLKYLSQDHLKEQLKNLCDRYVE